MKDTKDRPNKFNDCFNFSSLYPLKNYNIRLFSKNIGSKFNPKHNHNKRQSNNHKIMNKFDKKIEVNLKNDSSFELYQESASHLSTASEGGEHSINNNHNNNNYSQKNLSKKEEKTEVNTIKDEKDEIGLIKKAFKDIGDYFNSNQCNYIPLSCYYYCDINMNEKREYSLEVQIHNLAKNYEKNENKDINLCK